MNTNAIEEKNGDSRELDRYLKELSQPKQQDYELAIDRPPLRQQFLDNLLIENVPKFVRSIRYHNRKSLKGSLIYTAPNVLSGLGFKGYRAKIHVYSPAFSKAKFPTIEDFVSAVVDHEGFHAEECYFAKPEMVFPPSVQSFPEYDIWHALMELRAVRNQIKNSGHRNISDNYLERLVKIEKSTVDFLKSLGVRI